MRELLESLGHTVRRGGELAAMSLHIARAQLRYVEAIEAEAERFAGLKGEIVRLLDSGEDLDDDAWLALPESIRASILRRALLSISECGMGNAE